LLPEAREAMKIDTGIDLRFIVSTIPFENLEIWQFGNSETKLV
jgi:hypothetical protein